MSKYFNLLFYVISEKYINSSGVFEVENGGSISVIFWFLIEWLENGTVAFIYLICGFMVTIELSGLVLLILKGQRCVVFFEAPVYLRLPFVPCEQEKKLKHYCYSYIQTLRVYSSHCNFYEKQWPVWHNWRTQFRNNAFITARALWKTCCLLNCRTPV